jgi:hypothetical protein
MTISVLLAAGITALPSADTVLDDGAGATLILRGNGGVIVETKNSDGGYAPFGVLDPAAQVRQVFGPMTFRVRRELVVPAWAPAGQPAVAEAVGVDVDKA